MAQSSSPLTTDPRPRYENAVAIARVLLKAASDEWAKGDPETPSTDVVLNDILDLFKKEKFLRVPNS